MKFVFEADMHKGQCCACPLGEYDDFGEAYYCALDHSVVSLDIPAQDCPLDEYHGIVWHKYPQEKPPHHGRFCVSYVNVKRSNRKEFHCVKYSKDGFASYDKFIYAWAELPKPSNMLIDDVNMLITPSNEQEGGRR